MMIIIILEKMWKIIMMHGAMSYGQGEGPERHMDVYGIHIGIRER